MKVLEGFISKVEEASNNPSLGKMMSKQESFVDVWWWWLELGSIYLAI